LGIYWQRCRVTAVIGLLWLAGLRLTTLQAQNQTATPESAPRYFLFVVEASRSMKPRTQATLDVLQTLLNSAFDRQMRRGDILDAWAFNDTLHKMGAPAQADSQEARATLSVRLLDFVMSQASDKKANLDKVLPELNTLLHDSPFVTLILLSSGENDFHGSVCDGLINSSFKRLHEQQQQAQRPLVTVIRSMGGQITDCKVVAAPQAIKMPALPAPPVISAETKKTTALARTEPAKPASAAESQERPPAQPAPAPKPPDSAPSKPSPEASKPPPPVFLPAPASMTAVTAANTEKQAPSPAAVKDDPPPAQVQPSAAAAQPAGDTALGANGGPDKAKPASPTLLGVSAPSAPPRSFLRENGKFLLVSIAAILAAAFCFYNWLRTFAGRSGK
jgi:outer membrane biosynthesis protein TonB